jgi:hypothetical protein
MDVNPILIPIIFVTSIPIVAIGLPLAKAFASRLERKPIGSAVPNEVTARLERMEQAIDSIAVEVERISEGQRFTTKLLAERAAPAAPALPDNR